MLGPLSNADRCPTPGIRRYAALGHAAMGIRSLTGLNAMDLNHRKVTIGIPAPRGGRVFWPTRDRTTWERISAHLGVAFRLRDAERARDAPGLIMEQGGRTQHARPGLGDAARSRLRDAMAAVDRTRRVAMSPEAVLDAWRALYDGRWSIVAVVERDGRRFLVARPDAPLRDDAAPREAAAEAAGRAAPDRPRPLSAQERRATLALASGHSNKLIAYELGLTTSTVGTLLARAARKLGCTNRLALARAGRALALRSGEGGAA
jgi:DNA-binding CsgD family transcriptional regulator